MKYSLYLGKIKGIKISVHWTFLILIFWIVLVNMRQGLGWNETVWSILFVLAIFACVILHELGHSLTAMRYGITTKGITILPIGGVAELESIPEDPKQELWVALAGPAVNIAIAAALYPFVRLSTDIGELQTLQTVGPQNFLVALMSVNLWLAIFNLIPAFPMDGGRVLRAVLAFRMSHASATRVAATIGQVLAIGFVFFGFMTNPFLIFIGLFIFLGAQAEAVASRSKLVLKGYTVNDVLMKEVPVIPAEAPLKEAVTRLLNSQNKNFVVVRGDKPVGTLTRNEIIAALSARGESALVDDLKDEELVILSRAMPLEQAWMQLQQHRKPLMLVMTDGVLEGIVDEENMSEFILVRTAANQRDNPSRIQMAH